ncbi:MAG TPA: hypothetical protein VNJ01_01055 [Bacteriovoracaceae bacterium]|nr:hypothetical protein [Bacteriovoracaceae bacterium]
MNETEQSLNVLKKILRSTPPETPPPGPETIIEKFHTEVPSPQAFKISKRSPGRPRVDETLKAKNITLCIAHRYLLFLDKLHIPGKEDLGRGRKIRYIIDQFIDLKKRQKDQLAFLKEALSGVEIALKEYSDDVKKGKKLELSIKERAEISKVVTQVLILVRVLAYTPKSLFKILPKQEWAVLSFCLDWSRKREEFK